MLHLFLAATLSLYEGPRPEPTATYRDWIVGCDNKRDCAAIALESAGASDSAIDHLEVQIDQPLAQHLDPVITIRPQVEQERLAGLRLAADGAELAPPAIEGPNLVYRGAGARALVQVLRGAHWLSLREAGAGNDLARASLSGLTAALLKIDERQNKVGKPRALASAGTGRYVDDLPGYSVTLSRPAASGRPATRPLAGSAPPAAKCAAGEETRSEETQFIRLDDDHTLMIRPWRCGDGAYNHLSDIFIVDGWGEVKPAKFDFDIGYSGDGPGGPLVNAGWDPEKRVLESHILHRALGDCGRVDHFIWDGAQFRLSEQRAMPECRGSMGRIRVWTVDVADR